MSSGVSLPCWLDPVWIEPFMVSEWQGSFCRSICAGDQGWARLTSYIVVKYLLSKLYWLWGKKIPILFRLISKHTSRLRVLDLMLLLAQLPKLPCKPVSLWVLSLVYADVGLLHDLMSHMIKRSVSLLYHLKKSFSLLWNFGFIIS